MDGSVSRKEEAHQIMNFQVSIIVRFWWQSVGSIMDDNELISVIAFVFRLSFVVPTVSRRSESV